MPVRAVIITVKAGHFFVLYALSFIEHNVFESCGHIQLELLVKPSVCRRIGSGSVAALPARPSTLVSVGLLLWGLLSRLGEYLFGRYTSCSVLLVVVARLFFLLSRISACPSSTIPSVTKSRIRWLRYCSWCRCLFSMQLFRLDSTLACVPVCGSVC